MFSFLDHFESYLSANLGVKPLSNQHWTYALHELYFALLTWRLSVLFSLDDWFSLIILFYAFFFQGIFQIEKLNFFLLFAFCYRNTDFLLRNFFNFHFLLFAQYRYSVEFILLEESFDLSCLFLLVNFSIWILGLEIDLNSRLLKVLAFGGLFIDNLRLQVWEFGFAGGIELFLECFILEGLFFPLKDVIC